MVVIKFDNPNPTEAEKQLFFYAGYYCVDGGGITVNNNAEFKQLTYVVVNHGLELEGQKIFPQHLEIDNKAIDYESIIVFDTLSETVKISNYLDIDHLSFVLQRMNELGFKRCLPCIADKSNKIIESDNSLKNVVSKTRKIKDGRELIPIEYIVKWENCFKEKFELTFSAYRQAKTCADYNNGKIFDKSDNEITEQNSSKYVWKEMEILGVSYPKI